MWIKNNNNLYNCEQFYRIFPKGVKLIGMTTNDTEVILGEFWTAKECMLIFASILQNELIGEKVIFIKNTRDGMKCLKSKKVKYIKKDFSELIQNITLTI